MNTSGFIRGMMSKNMEGEKFFIHVATCIERELQQWDSNYNVMLMKLVDYDLVVSLQDESYQVSLTEDELTKLQQQGPYALDRRIWMELEQQGLKIIGGCGNYLGYVYLDKMK